MLVQPQQAATVCEFDPVPHTIGSLERAQTLDPNPRPENSHGPLNLTLDLEHAHVSDRSRSPAAGACWPCRNLRAKSADLDPHSSDETGFLSASGPVL